MSDEILARGDPAEHMVKAPFDQSQIVSLNEFQHSNLWHPFTCGRCRDDLGTWFKMTPEAVVVPADDEWDNPSFDRRPVFAIDRLLVATAAGWMCPTCSYTQSWAWDWMANDAWRLLRKDGLSDEDA